MAAEEHLQVTGQPGSRRLTAPAGKVEFTEHEDCGWIILTPVRTWQEWRDLAWQVLETGDPG